MHVQVLRSAIDASCCARSVLRAPGSSIAAVGKRLSAPISRCRLPVAATADGGQPPLTQQERKALRAESQRLGKQLYRAQLGQKGMTPAFLQGAWDALSANGLIKVKVGAADGALDALEARLTAALDAVVVHKIGFTLTLYRDPALAPPPAFCAPPSPGTAAAEPEAEVEEQAGRRVLLEGGWGDEPDAEESWDSEDEELLGEEDEEEEEEAAAGEAPRRAERPAGGGGNRDTIFGKPKPPEFTIIG